MKTLWLVLGLVLAVLAAPGVALAQEASQTPSDGSDEPLVAPDVPPGDDVIEHLALHAPAPVEGMLMDMDTSIRWTHRIEWYRAELQLQHRMRVTLLDAERRSHAVELQLTTDSMQREIDGLRQDIRTQAATAAQQLAQARDRPFYDSFGFGFIMGVVVTGLLVGLTAIIIVVH